jgi:acyl transferase domain-containing protein
MESIAIVGLAGRFPQARNVKEYWRNLRDGVECVTFFSEAELLDAGVPADLVRRPDYVPAKGFLNDAEFFDAAFFGIHPRDAEIIDPQQRLLLEASWAALEDAGYSSDRFDGAIGVFVGVSMNTYMVNNLLGNRELLGTIGGYQVMISNDKDYAATRISYLLNLTGPSMGIQTACSSSLVAVERACQSLVNQECDVALAGGASLSFPRRAGYLYEEGMILSPDGHCRVFDARARGTVGGEGVGLVVLKRLKDALRDGDAIRAILRGWATNNDGSDKVGFTAPAANGQAAVIATALATAGVSPRSISYVEAHGTGTELGDPIEINALTRVYTSSSTDRGYCRIGSVKSSIGHLDAAAGIAGLIKTTLALQHRRIPPTLHFLRPNPLIDFDNGPFRVVTQAADWDTDHLPRRAAVSSFGIGGTNAHVVLEEPPTDSEPRPSRSCQLLQLSAKSDAALEQATRNLADYLREEPAADLADVAYTLRVGRREFQYRRALVCRHPEEAIQIIESRDPSRLMSSVDRFSNPQYVFLFPGQGSQYAGMGRGLYDGEPCFREHFDDCAEILQPLLGLDLRETLFAQRTFEKQDAALLTDTSVAQPALFALEFALAQTLSEWGIRPKAMIGHSVGEYVAACLAGVFTVESALRLVAQRGQLMQSLKPGAMLAVPLSADEVREILDANLSIAASNSPENTVVAGTLDAIDRLDAFLQSQGFDTHRLHTSHAFHSAMMEPIREPFRRFVEQTPRRPPSVPFISNLTGTWITPEQAVDSNYWVDHLLHTVRFADGVSTLLQEPYEILLEVGPGHSLRTLARQNAPRTHSGLFLSTLRHAQEKSEDASFLLRTLGRIWLAGGHVDWPRFHSRERRRRVPLPTYPFERKRFLVDPPKAGRPTTITAKRRVPSDWFYLPGWRQVVPRISAVVDEAPASSTWLLLLDDCGVGAALQELLRNAGQQVVAVRLGAEFSIGPDQTFTLHPSRYGDYSALFEELRQRSLLPDRILHLLNVTRDEHRSFDEWQTLGFYSLLHIAQNLGRQPSANIVQWDIVTTDLQEVTGRERLTPAKATLRGPLLVIPQEYPHLILRGIDIELPPSPPQTAAAAASLFHELLRPVANTEMALRDRYAWIRDHQPVRVHSPQQRSPRLRPGGVYWIIGGLGQIGLAFARELARSAQARIVLTGRTALPPREQWETLIERNDPDAPEVRKCRQIIELESLGAEVLVAPADIRDYKQLQAVLNQIEERFGSLHAVIHSAGQVAGRIIHYLTRDTCETQFDAKVRGLDCLDKLLGARPLDFCLITSSMSSVVGGMGFCAYAAANAYLDEFAHIKNRQGQVPWLSVNWDGWDFRASRDSAPTPNLSELLSASDGQDAFARILTMDWPHRIVLSTTDLQLRIDQWVGRSTVTPEPNPLLDTPSILHPRPENLSVEFVAPRSELERTIADVWRQLLGIEQIGIHDNYIELGGHSLLAGRVISRIREQLKVPLSIRNLFEAPTVAQLASHVETCRWAMDAHKASSPTASTDPVEEIEL